MKCVCSFDIPERLTDIYCESLPSKTIPMKSFYILPAAICFCIYSSLQAQEQDKLATISLFTGAMNYQGDLKPDAFTTAHSCFTAGVSIRKPLTNFLAVRGGVNIGKIQAADEWNSDDLKSRNLSFTTTIKEVYIGLEISVSGIMGGKFTPYLYGGIGLFHINPWAYDNTGTKTYLKPLSTEGQGLPNFPDLKPYDLTQLCLPFGGGLSVAITNGINLGIEFNQRKSFTDYIDDVSSSYVDRTILLQEKGSKAVELAYRTDELPGGRPFFPSNGEKRGTASQKDWYYFFGLTSAFKINTFSTIFKHKKSISTMRCPRKVY